MSVKENKKPFLNELEDIKLSENLQNNLTIIKESLSHSDDLMLKKMTFNDKECYLIYIDSLIEESLINSTVIELCWNIKQVLLIKL